MNNNFGAVLSIFSFNDQFNVFFSFWVALCFVIRSPSQRGSFIFRVIRYIRSRIHRIVAAAHTPSIERECDKNFVDVKSEYGHEIVGENEEKYVYMCRREQR